MRQVGGDRDDRFRSAPDAAQGLRDAAGIGVADQYGDDFERRRQHRLQHHEVHFERMLAHERSRVDDKPLRLSELGMSARRHRRLAQRRAPLGRWMNRYARKRHAMGRANDDNAARRVGAPRPWSEGRCGDRARVDEAGVRRDDDLWRDASIGARSAARVGDQGVQRVRLRRIKHARDLRRVDRLGIARFLRQRMLLRDHLARAAELFRKVLELGQPVLQRQDQFLIVDMNAGLEVERRDRGVEYVNHSDRRMVDHDVAAAPLAILPLAEWRLGEHANLITPFRDLDSSGLQRLKAFTGPPDQERQDWQWQ